MDEELLIMADEEADLKKAFYAEGLKAKLSLKIKCPA